jgi:Multidrug resistance efflux pump
MLIILLLGIALILWAWRIGPFHNSIESTENSYVKGKTTVLSSQINGYVKDVLVTDFDHVKKGQVLMHIDATTYDQKVTQAESGVEQAQNSLPIKVKPLNNAEQILRQPKRKWTNHVRPMN